MLMRVALFVILCIGLAGFGTVTWIETRPAALIKADAGQPPAPVTVSVLVATRAIHAGSLLKPDDLTGTELPVASVVGSGSNRQQWWTAPRATVTPSPSYVSAHTYHREATEASR